MKNKEILFTNEKHKEVVHFTIKQINIVQHYVELFMVSLFLEIKSLFQSSSKAKKIINKIILFQLK